MRKIKSDVSRWIPAFIVAVLLLSSCGTSAFASEGAPPANCVIIVGDSKGGDDADIHQIVVPNGDKYTVGDGEDSWFVWCNPRNYLINEGKYTYLDGQRVLGDVNQPLEIITPTGVRIYLSVEIYWTLNQSEESLREFWPTCLKYNCASGEAYDPTAAENNFASVGWNGFLAENFLNSLWSAARLSTEGITDDIWLTEAVSQFNILETGISENFPKELRARLGFQNNIVCGSTTSAWQDPSNPEQDGNSFNCAPVRVKVTDITVAPPEEQTPAGQAILNQYRYDNASILYGDDTNEVLGDIDRIDTCVEAGANCTVIIGDTGGDVPNDAVTPEPTQAPEPQG